jgi:hypothetical protein
MSLKPRKMIQPLLLPSRNKVWKLELKQDIGEIIRERRPGQTSHILEDKGTRPSDPNAINGGGKHVSIIQESSMLASERERLAGRTAGYQIDSLECGEIEFPDITLNNLRPLTNGIYAALTILTKRGARVEVPFDDGLMVDTSRI